MGKPGRYSDTELLQALTGATPPDWAVRQLYIDSYAMAGSFVLKNGGTPEDAEDLFQEALVSFIEMVAAGRFRGDSKISSFLYSMVHNRWLNELRRRERAAKRARDFDQRLGDQPAGNPGSQPGDTLDNISRRELSTQLMQVIDTLGQICKKILLAFYYEDLPMKDILARVDYQNEQVLRNKKTKCMKQLVETLSAKQQLLAYFKSAIDHE